MQKFSVSKEIAGRTLTIESGTIARQAAGSVTVQYGETVVLGAVARANPREGLDFFPLQVEYRERRAAAGKFPGGFLKREGRPSNKEILTMRMVDRPLRPLFPSAFIDEVQIHLSVLAFDGENDPDMLAGIAASAAIALSDIPFETPTAHVRVGTEGDDATPVLMPTVEQMDDSDIDLVLAGTKNYVNMIEVGAFEVPEDEVADLIEFGHKAIKDICAMIAELAEKAGAPEKVWDTKPSLDQELYETIRNKAEPLIREAKGEPGKQDRGDKIKDIRKQIVDELAPELGEDAPYTKTMAQKAKAKEISGLFKLIEKHVTRQLIIEGTRPDGRGLDDIREITCEAGILPRVHGSALFTRGETQSLCTVVLGTSGDEQLVDGLTAEYGQKFMLHYNFPPYSVGEVRPIRGVSRRELGHGALAERALIAVLPEVDEFPYTVQVISDITESNGSSSMASACCGSLSLMDAGVPITTAVAGISCGLIKEGEGDAAKYHLLTDILGEEDGMGDMDFKVCGTDEGVTAIQLDIKIEGLPMSVIRETLTRCREARMKILDVMNAAVDEPREHISTHAPKLLTLKIDPEKIGKLIGPSGKTIRKIQEDFQVKIDVEDDGTVFIASTPPGDAEKARGVIEAMTQQVQVGRIYKGEVVSIKDFGCFVEIAPETDGLCHVSELSNNYVQRVTDYVKVGDEVDVKVILIDEQGRIKLSRKAAMAELGQEDAPVEGSAGTEGGEGEQPEGSGGGRPRRSGGGGRGRGGPRSGGSGGGNGDARPRRSGPPRTHESAASGGTDGGERAD